MGQTAHVYLLSKTSNCLSGVFCLKHRWWKAQTSATLLWSSCCFNSFWPGERCCFHCTAHEKSYIYLQSKPHPLFLCWKRPDSFLFMAHPAPAPGWSAAAVFPLILDIESRFTFSDGEPTSSLSSGEERTRDSPMECSRFLSRVKTSHWKAFTMSVRLSRYDSGPAHTCSMAHLPAIYRYIEPKTLLTTMEDVLLQLFTICLVSSPLCHQDKNRWSFLMRWWWWFDM